ncbi:MAG: sugar phosphate isomerase/epimerase [Clostridiales Family XIII bacterium]|jgi:sugar phosphate isomerase/epimerase|nr:sugar phosphate isomerase/epimerase [Clostridiales Family XIII bacterium]
MRLATSSPLEHSSPKEWATKHKSLGLGAINFPLTCEDDDTLISEYVKEAKKNDLLIAEVGVWRNTLDINEEARENAIQYAIGQLELADRIGARCCVNILGARGSRWDGAYKDNFTKETWKLGVKTIQNIIDEVNPKNTYFTIESMPWMFPTGPDEYLQLLESVDRDRFAVHMDVFNWITTPRRYFFNEKLVYECFEKLGEYIKSCHLKDVKMEDDYTLFFRETNPGNGGINIKHLIEKGLSFDEDMPFIIEHLNTDEEYLQSVAYIKNLLVS